MPWLWHDAAASRGNLLRAVPVFAMAMLLGANLGRAESPSQAGCTPSPAGEAFRNLPAPFAPSADTEIVHMRIGGNEFLVPRNYFRHPPIGCGVDEPGMLLRVLLPDMEGYTGENAREIEGLDEPGWGRRMNILVETFGQLRGYNRIMFQALSGGVDPTGAYPRQYGLLYTVSNQVRGGGPRSAVDVFFDRENGEVIRFIVCKGVAAVPSPSCQHRFLYGNLRVNAMYNRSRLASWSEIETEVRALLDRFLTSSTGQG
jgi:hypothetical protein